MADLSLDDFIKRNNVKVRVNNPQVKLKGNLQQSTTIGNKKNISKQIQNKKNFDARTKLGPKAVVDARNKISVIKKTGGGDARNKIVQKQVQKGVFDARSVLQRQAQKSVRKKGIGGSIGNNAAYNHNQNSTSVPLTRTLSNPNAKNRGQVRATPGGLQVTRPVPKTQVSLSGSSLQVTKRNQQIPGKASKVPEAVPIIQIRNDKYRHPVSQPLSALPRYSQTALQYSQQSYREPIYEDYPEDPYVEPPPMNSDGYRDWDNPQYNPASISMPEIPKVHVSNLKTIEYAGMRPVSYTGGGLSRIAPPPQRVPPGAASLSQQARPLVPKTVSSPPVKISPAGLKRKPPSAVDVSGPLRLGKGGGPGIDLDPSPNKKSKPSGTAGPLEVVDLESEADVISPLQGFRVMVTNLFNGVTQDDIIELFGAVGPLKKAKLLKPGSAEVVYISKQNAISAVQKYHSRELDGQPMYVKMTTPVAAVVKKVPGEATDPDLTGEALRLYKKPSGLGSLPEAPIEIPTIHRALFKAGPPGPNKSVKFTVKI